MQGPLGLSRDLEWQGARSDPPSPIAMRPLLFVAALALATAAPAAAQGSPMQPQLRSASPGSTIVLRSNAGEARRVVTQTGSVRQPGRLAGRYKSLRVNRTRPTQLRRIRTATPALRTIRTQEGRFVRRNGSHFRVRR